MLFVRPRDPREGDLERRRAGVEGAKERYGADEAYPVAELDEKLPALLEGAATLWFRLGARRRPGTRGSRGSWRAAGAARASASGRRDAIVDPGRILHELRLVKSPDEIAKRLRKAAEITAEAHMAAMRDGQPGRREYQVQAEIEYAFRRRGGIGPRLRHHRRGRRELDHPPLPRRTPTR